ncbi:MAG TPA: AbrB/MazE/SpoVT family DNA-binding domain-containing protein [Candidatus Kapabacteria bacterium]|nr:AbrB/MazE/SpoVT family DNA-binding domain-containing protein [Candidatus Kapabacteria bacterium]
MVLQVQKWGNSLAVRIPKQIAKDARIEEGSEVNVTEEAGKIVLGRVEKKMSLSELLARITADNIHGEMDFGKPRGNEIW